MTMMTTMLITMMAGVPHGDSSRLGDLQSVRVVNALFGLLKRVVRLKD